MATSLLRFNRRILARALLIVAGLSFCGHVLIFGQSAGAAALTAIWVVAIAACAGAGRPAVAGWEACIAPRIERSRHHPVRRLLELLRHAVTRQGLDRFLKLGFAATAVGTWLYFAGMLFALKQPIAAAAATTLWSALIFGILSVLRSVRRWYEAASEQEPFDGEIHAGDSAIS